MDVEGRGWLSSKPWGALRGICGTKGGGVGPAAAFEAVAAKRCRPFGAAAMPMLLSSGSSLSKDTGLAF